MTRKQFRELWRAGVPIWKEESPTKSPDALARLRVLFSEMNFAPSQYAYFEKVGDLSRYAFQKGEIYIMLLLVDSPTTMGGSREIRVANQGGAT